MTSTVEVPRLSPAQRKMLLAADKRYGRITRGGVEAHYTHVGRGQGGTARVLQTLGLGGYATDNGVSGAKFWIWERGHEVAQAIQREEVVG